MLRNRDFAYAAYASSLSKSLASNFSPASSMAVKSANIFSYWAVHQAKCFHWCYPISMVVASLIVQTSINILVLFAGSAQVVKQIILAFLGLMFGRSSIIGRGGDRRVGGGGGGGHDSLS
jgi:hypothetical protein